MEERKEGRKEKAARESGEKVREREGRDERHKRRME